jgi:hypothetical protein
MSTPAAITEHGDRSVGALFGELANEVGTLVRQESRLATRELTEKATFAGKQVGFIAAGMLLATISLAVLVAAAVMALEMVLVAWAAALIVAIVVGAAAFAVASKGITALRKLDPRPRLTLQTLEETKLWARQQVR